MKVKILDRLDSPINEFYNNRRQPIYKVIDAQLADPKFRNFTSPFWVWEDELKPDD